MNSVTYILNIINNIDSYPEFKKYYLSLTEEQKYYFLKTLNSLDHEPLYKSPIHGQFHSEKVLFFTYLLAVKYNYDEIDMKILVDAAMYHDIGRRSDINDTLHGLCSANLFGQRNLFDSFYNNPSNLKLIQAIMDAHSYKDGRRDTSLENIYYNYDLATYNISFEKFKAMAHLLMDADALDRKRFLDDSPAGLKPEFLHYPESKEMVALAGEINEAYRTLSSEEKISLDELYASTGAVAHSIGFVFPRIVSVLTHGILSSSEMKKKNIEQHRNFNGGNSERWISVAPIDKISSVASSIDAFFKNGIVVVAKNITYYDTPYTNSDASIAIMKNLPYNKGQHEEERYVLDKIDPHQFTELYISKDCCNKDLTELKYIFPNLDVKAYLKMITDLCNKYQAEEKDLKIVQDLYEKYKESVLEYIYLDKESRIYKRSEYASRFEQLNRLINGALGIIIKKYYVKYFKTTEDKIITPTMVLKDQLDQLGIEYEEVITVDKTSFYISNTKQNKKDSGLAI